MGSQELKDLRIQDKALTRYWIRYESLLLLDGNHCTRSPTRNNEEEGRAEGPDEWDRCCSVSVSVYRSVN